MVLLDQAGLFQMFISKPQSPSSECLFKMIVLPLPNFSYLPRPTRLKSEPCLPLKLLPVTRPANAKQPSATASRWLSNRRDLRGTPFGPYRYSNRFLQHFFLCEIIRNTTVQTVRMLMKRTSICLRPKASPTVSMFTKKNG